MSLHKINKYTMQDDLVDNDSTLSRKVITKMIYYVSVYNKNNKSVGTGKLFINENFMDDFFSQTHFSMPSFDVFKKDGIIGKIGGVDVYISDSLDEHEIFIGESEKQLQITKRNKKITNILQR